MTGCGTGQAPEGLGSHLAVSGGQASASRFLRVRSVTSQVSPVAPAPGGTGADEPAVAGAEAGAGAVAKWTPPRVDVRHQFGDDWADPDTPLLPSERRDRHTGRCTRVGAEAMRQGLAGAVGAGCQPGRGS
jgi:hypothetical protein